MSDEQATTTDPVTAYAMAGAAGEIVVNRFVRMACERHLRDLETAAERGLDYDPEAAAHGIDFCEQWLSLPEGGAAFLLSPFQKFILGSLLGWKGKDGYRRFRTAYIESGKGSGKTPLAAAIALYGLVADGEAAAEIYFAAPTAAQAGIGFRDARRMAAASTALASRLEIQTHNIAHPESGSFLRAVSSEHRGLDGRRVHVGIIDEIHEHPNALVVDKVRAGTKGRKQAMVVEITNSGFDKDTICWHHHLYSTQILEGSAKDDSWFAFVCGLDACEKCLAAGKLEPQDGCADGDDYRDPAVWPKANPNINVSVGEKYLQEQVHEAEGIPSKASIVKRLNFCIWTDGAFSTWIQDSDWMDCATGFDLKSLEGQDCYAGLDLAARSDFASLMLVFPINGEYYLLPFCWLPEEGNRDLRTEPIASFVRQKLIELTPGPSTEFAAIRAKINELHQRYNIRKIAVDPWQSRSLAADLINDGFEVQDFPQTLRNFTAPTKEFAVLVKGGRLHHDGNALTRWQMSHVQIETDHAGNEKPSKRKSGENRIDSIVAGIMALAMAMEPNEEKNWGIFV